MADDSSPASRFKPAIHGGAQNLARRVRRLGVSGRRFRKQWTRERFAELGRTLLWVAPLTLLIWVWAQDQQIETATQQNVPLHLSHTDNEQVLLRLVGNDAIPLDRITLSSVTFQGPRVGLTEVVTRLRENGDAPLLDIKLDLAPVDRVAIDIRTQLNELAVLRDAGVSVVDVTPAQVYLRVEPLEEMTAEIIVDPDTPYALAGRALFEPPTVTLQGPASAIQRLRDQAADDTGPTVIADLPEDVPVAESMVRNVPLRLPSDAPNLSLSPSSVRATFTRAAEVPVRTILQRVVVRESTPAAMSGQYLVEIEPTVINNVTIEGPPDVISRIQRGEVPVEAVLVLDRDDQEIREPTRRRLEITLPPNATLIGDPPEVTFRLRRSEGPL